MAAEFSYFLEKYFGITSIIWTVIFLAVCCAIVFAVTVKICEHFLHRKLQYIYLGITAICSFIANFVIFMSYTWDSKLQRVLSNFKYVMSFSSNREIMFDTLLINNTEESMNKLSHIAMYLDASQWNKVEKAAEDAGWYFEKVENAIRDILMVGDYHFTKSVYCQDIFAYIPVIMIAVLAVIVFKRQKKIESCIVLGLAIMSIGTTLGGSIFICTMLYIGYVLNFYIEYLQKVSQKHKIHHIKKNIMMEDGFDD